MTIVIQSIEFLDDDVVTFSWAEEDDSTELYGEVRKAWVNLNSLPEWVGETLYSVAEHLVLEYHAFKRDAPESIEPREA